MKKIYVAIVALLAAYGVNAQTVIYSNDFNSGVGTSTIVGSGQIIPDATPGFGSVFHNAVGGQAVRSNYLLLPNDVFVNLQASGSKELSIGFWVNKGTAADNFWTPIFSAYGAAPIDGANTWPMMIFQSRLVTQVNCSGWSDFVDVDNVNGTNTVSVTWLDDAAWHYFTATVTETSLKIYIDGAVQNEWTLNGTEGHTVSGLFTNGADLKYICLGGNQAWDWNDVDPAYKFDDLAIYANALTAEQINAIIAAKPLVTSLPEPATTDRELVTEAYFSISGKNVGSDYTALQSGIYIKKSVYSNGAVASVKVVKAK